MALANYFFNPLHCKHDPKRIIPPDAEASLNQYPLVLAGPGTEIPVVYRAHRTYGPDGLPYSPLYYSPAWDPEVTDHPGGRFDLQGSKGLGTCNTGRSVLAVIREKLGTELFKWMDRGVIPRYLLDGLSVSRIRPKRPIVLVDARVDGPGYCADCLSDVTHKGTKYALTQSWAQGIYELGAGGNISTSCLRHTENVYLYGPAGVYEGDLEVEETVSLVEAYQECLDQGADLPRIIEFSVDDFGGTLRDSLPPA